MLGFVRFPSTLVVYLACLSPMSVVGFINLNASMTTLPRTL